MFPNAHTKSISDVSIQYLAKPLHASNLKVVNPTSDELIKFLHLISVANSPTTASEFFHSLFKLRY